MRQLLVRSLTAGASGTILVRAAPAAPYGFSCDPNGLPWWGYVGVARRRGLQRAWWSIFDPVLGDLFARAEARNDSIAIADLDWARAVASIARADQAPRLNAGASVTRGEGIGGHPARPQQPRPLRRRPSL